MAVDLVYSGGGSLAVQELGAHAALTQWGLDIEAVIGTSAGSIIAGLYGVGMPAGEALRVFQDAFSGGVLDPSVGALPRFGLHKGDLINQVLRQHMYVRMGDLKREVRIVVCDLWTRQPVLVTKKTHPKVFLSDAVRCSIAIPGFFAASRLSPDNARLYVDGGCAKNFAMDAADDLPGTTVGVRVRGRTDAMVMPVREWDVKAYFAALAGLMMYASDNANDSQKADAKVLTIQSDDDSLDFSLSKEQCVLRYNEGYKAAWKWLKDGGLR